MIIIFYNNLLVNNIEITEPQYIIVFPKIIFFFSFGLISLSFLGFLSVRFNFIFLMFFLELFLLGIGILFILISFLRGNADGYILTLCILTVSAGEAAFGLSLIVALYRLHSLPQLDYFLEKYVFFFNGLK